jgi:hypothetical protein
VIERCCTGTARRVFLQENCILDTHRERDPHSVRKGAANNT